MSQDNASAMQDASAGVGTRLREAREALGLSRADIAARTKIAERHLTTIEESRFADLASRAYAIGFSRTYARAVGLDEKEVAASLRSELGMAESQADQAAAAAYEPVDPSRVPSSQTAWLAGLAGLILIIVGWIVWSQVLSADRSAPPPPPPTAVAPATRTPVANGPVILTALEDGVWVQVTDAGGAQLFQKEMARGESWTVPADAASPSLRTARPDAVQVSIGTQAVAPLSTTRQMVSGVVLTAEALRARSFGQAAPTQAGAAPAALPVSPAPRPERIPAARPAAAASPVTTATPPQAIEGAAPAPVEAAAPAPVEAAAPAPVAASPPANASTETD